MLAHFILRQAKAPSVFSPVFIREVSHYNVMSNGSEIKYYGSPERVGTTGSPAEDIEEERAKNRLWDLKEEAKWGKDIIIQKNAIQGLSKNGTPAISYLEEVLSVLPPGELRQFCKEAMNSIIHPLSDEAKNPAEKDTERTSEKESEQLAGQQS